MPVAAIRRGLATIVPIRLLRLFSAPELETLVAGRAEISVDVLMAHTQYSGFEGGAGHPVVKRFWRVMRAFSDEERSKVPHPNPALTHTRTLTLLG